MWRTPGINLVLKRAITPSPRSFNPFSPRNRTIISAFHHPRHYCNSTTTAVGTGNSTSQVEALKERLRSENREVISYNELITACQSIGVAKSSDEASVFARSLDDAGVVLLFRDKVYLHPDKVVDLIRKAVPLSLLTEIESGKDELMKLQEKKEEIDELAHKQVRRILWAGLGLLVAQSGLFFRLTFWEFSWDVMEPIAFFTTTAGIVAGYSYFMFTSRDPSYQDLLKCLFLSRQRNLIKSRNFDIKRFVELQRKCKSPTETCASIRRRLGVEVEPKDLLHGH